MADNKLYIPELNPVVFYKTTRENLPKYFTKQFEDFMYSERIYFWQQRDSFKQVWQVEDIICLQFESEFDPIIVKLLDQWGQTVLELPALIGLPNKFIPNTFSFEVKMALAGLITGCYRVQVEAGVPGPFQEIYISDCQYISATPLENTFLMEYWNSRFHKDVVFETGIRFQLRVMGVLGFLKKVRKDDVARDQKYTSTLLNSRSAKQWPVYFGIPGDGVLSQKDFCGLPDDIINIIDEAWSCDNVLLDNKAFTIADGTEPEYTVVDANGIYTKRGMKVQVEAGINRNSRVYAVTTDTTKKLITTIIVDASVFGDLANQGSANTVPVINTYTE